MTAREPSKKVKASLDGPWWDAGIPGWSDFRGGSGGVCSPWPVKEVKIQGGSFTSEPNGFYVGGQYVNGKKDSGESR